MSHNGYMSDTEVMEMVDDQEFADDPEISEDEFNEFHFGTLTPTAQDYIDQGWEVPEGLA